MSTYLITTDEERAWPKNGKVLFLGEWCKRRDRKQKWSKFDSITADPYAIERKERREINDYADELFEVLLCEMANELNRFHKVSFSKRYWYIMIGRWLHKHIRVVISRHNKIKLALNNFCFDRTIAIDYSERNLTASTYAEFTEYLNNDSLWSHAVYLNILKNLAGPEVTFIQKAISSSKHNQKSKNNFKTSWREKVKLPILTLCKTFTYFKKNSDAVIIKSYLPMFQEIKLQLSLKQAPQLWSTPKAKFIEVDMELRSQFFQNYKKYKGVEREVRRMIHMLLPTCYLEGYESLSEQSDKLPWPANPKFIYTSNSFSLDEVFKLWAAKKSELGTPYYIGQHGNSYGTLRRTRTLPDVNTCDKFISWGWSGVYYNTRVIPAFIFNTINQRHLNLNKKGGLLLIGEPIPNEGSWCQDQFYEHVLYQKRVLCFLNTLGESIKNRTTIRLHGSYRKREIFNPDIWRTGNSNISIDFGVVNIFKAISESRLSVFSYESTGVLENLSLNLPMVCFWHNGLDDLFSDAIPYYKLLIDVEILHESPESAAKHIKRYWNNIDEWWGSEKVQNARKVFCNQYARQVDNPILTLRNLLLQD